MRWYLKRLNGYYHEDVAIEEVIHVLVDLPETSIGRDKININMRQDVPLSLPWQYSQIKMMVLPQPEELSTLLRRLLPFRMSLVNMKYMEPVVDANGPLISCWTLESLTGVFLTLGAASITNIASKNLLAILLRFTAPDHDRTVQSQQPSCKEDAELCRWHRNNTKKHETRLAPTSWWASTASWWRRECQYKYFCAEQRIDR